MKVAEVEINTRVNVKTNDVEYRLFRDACDKLGENPSFVLRRFMRKYTKAAAKG